MNDTAITLLCFSGSAVCGGIAYLYWMAVRESRRMEKLAEADKTRLESVYAQIHRNTLGRGAGSGEKRAAASGDSAAPHIIEVKPRACAPTVRIIDSKGEKP